MSTNPGSIQYAVNPQNDPMHPNQLAQIWFPDMPGFNAKPANHNGGLRKAPTVALGLVARMAAKGLMERWVDPQGFDRRSLWRISKAGMRALTSEKAQITT